MDTFRNYSMLTAGIESFKLQPVVRVKTPVTYGDPSTRKSHPSNASQTQPNLPLPTRSAQHLRTPLNVKQRTVLSYTMSCGMEMKGIQGSRDGPLRSTHVNRFI